MLDGLGSKDIRGRLLHYSNTIGEVWKGPKITNEEKRMNLKDLVWLSG